MIFKIIAFVLTLITILFFSFGAGKVAVVEAVRAHESVSAAKKTAVAARPSTPKPTQRVTVIQRSGKVIALSPGDPIVLGPGDSAEILISGNTDMTRMDWDPDVYTELYFYGGASYESFAGWNDESVHIPPSLPRRTVRLVVRRPLCPPHNRFGPTRNPSRAGYDFVFGDQRW